ncbi:phospho-acceptor domain-containing protein [Paenibacillus taihuensis]|uniref:histidine kinase n=1 Tax=Paenibacillus taihuensis TaxID=1156355 RepID=A0A3D9RKD1_9BACL|nr:ATP-binding protein [Paenibacillus taihuensis]REE80207.1 phospho-acceptor domain-containing protein [Paenibacillus taihuensis]
MNPRSPSLLYPILFDRHPEAILATDLEACIDYANPAAVQAFARPPLQSLLGTRIHTLFAEEDLPVLHKHIQQAISLGEAQLFDLKLPANGQAPTPLRIMLVPQAEPAQALTFYLTTYTKLSSLPIYFAEEPSSYDINRVEHLSTVSQLAASISHEVRNPLSVTRGFLQLMTTPGLTTDKQKDYIKISLEELDRAAGIITDYLSFAKPVIDETVPFFLYDELEYIAKMMIPYATIRDIRFQLLNEAQGIQIFGSTKKFRQALINLIKNGIEAMPSGGELRLACTGSANGIAHIEIADTGTGMDAEMLKRVGKPFFTTKEKGTGLGMMVAYSLIQGMNGEIEVSSKVGEGTCFSIYLPIIEG